MKLSRRDFMKANAAVAAAAAAGLTIPTVAQAVAGSADAMPFLRHRLRGAGRHSEWPYRCLAGRSGRGGQPWVELHQRLFPAKNHVRQRPSDSAAAAHERRPVP